MCWHKILINDLFNVRFFVLKHAGPPLCRMHIFTFIHTANNTLYIVIDEETRIASLDQAKRRQRIKNICRKNQIDKNWLEYKSKDGNRDQRIGKSFLVSETPGVIYCFNHKVASSTFMALFARLYEPYDKKFVSQLNKSGMFYRFEQFDFTQMHNLTEAVYNFDLLWPLQISAR